MSNANFIWTCILHLSVCVPAHPRIKKLRCPCPYACPPCPALCPPTAPLTEIFWLRPCHLRSCLPSHSSRTVACSIVSAKLDNFNSPCYTAPLTKTFASFSWSNMHPLDSSPAPTNLTTYIQFMISSTSSQFRTSYYIKSSSLPSKHFPHHRLATCLHRSSVALCLTPSSLPDQQPTTA